MSIAFAESCGGERQMGDCVLIWRATLCRGRISRTDATERVPPNCKSGHYQVLDTLTFKRNSVFQQDANPLNFSRMCSQIPSEETRSRSRLLWMRNRTVRKSFNAGRRPPRPSPSLPALRGDGSFLSAAIGKCDTTRARRPRYWGRCSTNQVIVY